MVPEWVLWFADAVTMKGLQDDVYLWSDDNLSNDYLWRFLERAQIQRLSSYAYYGRVGCFKGFDENSFSFNTKAPPAMFSTQFSLMRRLVDAGFDVYGYATFTSNSDKDLTRLMANFVDRLQTEVHPVFPLRTVPLRILEFSPTKDRMTDDHRRALDIQKTAVAAWTAEIERRFPSDVRNKQVFEHRLHT